MLLVCLNLAMYVALIRALENHLKGKYLSSSERKTIVCNGEEATFSS